MADEIRFRVWLLGGAPIAIVVGVLAVYMLTSHQRPAAALGPSSGGEWVEPSTPVAVALPPSTTAASDPRPRPAPPPPSTSSVAAAASSALGEPPEPIPELEALYWRPPGSEHWTEEQKNASRQQRLDDLDARERTLEREIAAARRSGDRGTEQQKTATLSYLRQKRAEVESRMGAHMGAHMEAGK